MTAFVIEDVCRFPLVTQIPVSANCHTITHLFTFSMTLSGGKLFVTLSLIPVFTETTINHLPTL